MYRRALCVLTSLFASVRELDGYTRQDTSRLMACIQVVSPDRTCVCGRFNPEGGVLSDIRLRACPCPSSGHGHSYMRQMEHTTIRSTMRGVTENAGDLASGPCTLVRVTSSELADQICRITS